MCLNKIMILSCHRANMFNYAHDLLKRLQTLLVISPVSTYTIIYSDLLI